jgi:hypothetical protein
MRFKLIVSQFIFLLKKIKNYYMKLSFNVSYKSNWGQQLYVIGSDELLGNWEPEDGLVMSYLGNDQWSVEVDAREASFYEYKYLVREANGVTVWEGGNNRKILTSTYQKVSILDSWHAAVDHERVLFTKIFSRQPTKTLMVIVSLETKISSIFFIFRNFSG